jgi:hypothetical protein
VTIVGSILLAFAIDTWWDGRQRIRAEQEALAGLRADFAASLDEMNRIIVGHQNRAATVARLALMSEAQRRTMPPDSMWRFTSAMAAPATFAPRDATLDDLIASGRLVVVSDPLLRERLVEWKRLVADVAEEDTRLYDAANAVSRRIIELGGPLPLAPDVIARTMPGLLEVRRRDETSDLERLAGDQQLADLVETKLFLAATYLIELRRMADHARIVLDLIETRIQARSNAPSK